MSQVAAALLALGPLLVGVIVGGQIVGRRTRTQSGTWLVWCAAAAGVGVGCVVSALFAYGFVGSLAPCLTPWNAAVAVPGCLATFVSVTVHVVRKALADTVTARG